MDEEIEEEGDWFDPLPFIEDSYKLTEVIGEWPSFDDAELICLVLDRTDGSPHIPGSNSPTLSMTVRLAETGFYLTEIRFNNVENLEQSNFSYQNEIREIVFDRTPPKEWDPDGKLESAKLLVEIEAQCGMQAKFECRSAIVLSVVLGHKDGSISGA
jgi:hypothetical protein